MRSGPTLGARAANARLLAWFMYQESGPRPLGFPFLNRAFTVLRTLASKAAVAFSKAQVGHAEAPLGMMAGQTPDDRASPLVADPDRLFAAQRIEKLDHVRDGVLQRVVLVPRIDARPAITPHVRRGRPETETAEAGQLMPPADRELGPPVHEHDQGRGLDRVNATRHRNGTGSA